MTDRSPTVAPQATITVALDPTPDNRPLVAPLGTIGAPGADAFVNFEPAEVELGFERLRATDPTFGLDRFSAVLVGGSSGFPAGARLPYFSDPQLRNKLVITQARQSYGLPKPPSTAAAERIDGFEVIVWNRPEDGSWAATFETGAVADDEPIHAFVNASSVAQLRLFVASLRFVD